MGSPKNSESISEESFPIFVLRLRRAKNRTSFFYFRNRMIKTTSSSIFDLRPEDRIIPHLRSSAPKIDLKSGDGGVTSSKMGGWVIQRWRRVLRSSDFKERIVLFDLRRRKIDCFPIILHLVTWKSDELLFRGRAMRNGRAKQFASLVFVVQSFEHHRAECFCESLAMLNSM